MARRRASARTLNRNLKPKHGYGPAELAAIGRTACQGLGCEAIYADPDVPGSQPATCGASLTYKQWWIIVNDDGVPHVLVMGKCRTCGSYRRIPAGPL